MADELTLRRAKALLLETADEVTVRAATPKWSVDRAVRWAWSRLHREGPEVMSECFRRWADAEGVSRPVDLGGVLRRRYDRPLSVVASLKHAATREGADG